MAISIEAREDLVTLVVGMFDAAPGAAVLTDLTVAYEAGIAGGASSADVMANIATSLASSSFYKEIYPEFLTNSEFAIKLVNNLAGDTLDGAAKADASALLLAQLNGMDTSTAASKAAARAAVTMTAIAAIESASAEDETFGALKSQFTNKVEVASFYSVDQQQNITGLADAQDVIKDVDETEESVTAAKADITGGANEGDEFDLTVGVDNLVGTSADDTFNSFSVNGNSGDDDTTLNAFDRIDGGDGEDTLNIYTDQGDTENNTFSSNTTVKNVEIVNIYQADGVATDFGDASNYEGVQQLWQIGDGAADVDNLGANTTAGFRGTKQAALNVTADAAVASIALDKVTDNVAGGDSIVDINIDGDDLNTVNVSGDISAAASGSTKRLDLNITMGEDEQKLTLSTAANATVDVTDNGDPLTELDASGSTGGVTFTGSTNVHTITGGAGADTLELGTTFSATVETATVNSGAGNDSITIDPTNAGIVNVDAGTGNDTVTVDTIGDLDTDSMLDGGEGTDTIKTAGGTLDAEDFTLLNNLFTNFEAITFTAASKFDASRLSDYKKFTLEAGTVGNTIADGITKVANDQSIAIEADATITAAGYSAATTPNTYAGELNVSSSDGDATATVNAEKVNLTVTGEASLIAGGSNSTTLAGDVKEAVVTVNNFSTPASTALFGAADVTVETVDGGSLDALTTLTLSGTGAAEVTNDDGTALVTIDASGLNTVDSDGDATTGLTYTTSNTKAESISLGAGYDELTIEDEASTVEAMDSITGFSIVAEENDADSYDSNASDILNFEGTAGTLESLGEIDANTFALALVDVAADAGANVVIFDYDGDSYVYYDDDQDGEVSDTDSLVKLVGGVDHDLAIDGGVVVTA